LGYFSTREEARAAHDKAVQEHLGEQFLKAKARVSGGNSPPKKLPQGDGDFSRGENSPGGMPA
jgi:hypothetical protein